MYRIAGINNSDIGWESLKKHENNKKSTRIERIHQIQKKILFTKSISQAHRAHTYTHKHREKLNKINLFF